MTIDSLGNIYTAQNETGVSKYTSSGSKVWNTTIDGAVMIGTFNAVEVDSSGNVYAVASTTTLGSDYEMVLIKMNNDGVIQWQRGMSLSGFHVDGASVKIDSSGNIYVSGSTRDSSTYASSIFLVKYDSTGTLVWQRTLTTANDEAAYELVLEGTTNIYMAGITFNASSIGSGLLVKYNSSGVLQWQRSLSVTSKNVFATAVGIDSSANLYVSTFNITDFEVTTAKYNTSGVLQWQRQLAVLSGSGYSSITTDSSGNSYVVTDDGNGLVIAKYNTSGTIQWQRNMLYYFTSFGGFGTNFPQNLSGRLDSSGNLLFPAWSGGGSASGQVIKIPNDGTKNDGVTHYYGSNYYTYSATTYTDSAGSRTNAASTLTNAAGSITAFTSTHTSGTFTSPYSIQILNVY